MRENAQQHSEPVPTYARGDHSAAQQHKPLHLPGLQHMHYRLKPQEPPCGHAGVVGPSSVSLQNGRVLVDGVEPLHQRITGHEVHWSRPLTYTEQGSEGTWEHGHLNLFAHRLQGYGSVVHTKGFDGPEVASNGSGTAEGGSHGSEAHTIRFNADAALHFTTSRAPRPADPSASSHDTTDSKVPSAAGADWVAFRDVFVVPTDTAAGYTIPTVRLDIPELNEMPGSFRPTFSINRHNQAVMVIDIDASMVAPLDCEGTTLLPESARFFRYEAVFSYDFHTFGGFMWAYDPERDDHRGERYDWCGTVVPQAAPPAVTPMDGASGGGVGGQQPAAAVVGSSTSSSSRAASMAASVVRPLVSGVASVMSAAMALRSAKPLTTALTTTDAAAGANGSSTPGPHPRTLAMAALPQLSVQELRSIPMPGSELTHRTNLNVMRLAMMYHIDDKTRKAFGIVRPDPGLLAAGGIDLAGGLTSKQVDMLVGKLAPAYLAQVLALSSDPVISKLMTEDEKQAVTNFMRAAGPGTLSAEPEYTTVNYLTSAWTYFSLCPGLVKYSSAAGQDGQHWAKALFESLKTPQTLREIARAMQRPRGAEQLHHFIMIMNALEPGCMYGQTLAEEVMKVQLAATLQFVKLDQKGSDTVFVSTMKQVLTQIVLQGSGSGTGSGTGAGSSGTDGGTSGADGSGGATGAAPFTDSLEKSVQELAALYNVDLSSDGTLAGDERVKRRIAALTRRLRGMLTSFCTYLRTYKGPISARQAVIDWSSAMTPDELQKLLAASDSTEGDGDDDGDLPDPFGGDVPPLDELSPKDFTMHMSFALYGFQFAAVVMFMYFNYQAYVSFDSLEPLQRAKLITSTVQGAFTAFKGISEKLGIVVDPAKDGAAAAAAAMRDAARESLRLSANVENNVLLEQPLDEQAPVLLEQEVQNNSNIAVRMSDVASQPNAVEAQSKQFRISSTLLRGINVLFICAGVVFTAFEIAKDDTGSSAFWVHVLSESAQGVLLLSEVGALALETGIIASSVTLSSVLACTGAFAIVALLVLAIASSFMTEDSETTKESPAETWYKDTGRAFVQALTLQAKPEPPTITTAADEVTFSKDSTSASFEVAAPKYTGAAKEAASGTETTVKRYTLSSGFNVMVTNTQDADGKPGTDFFPQPLKGVASPVTVTGLKPGYSYVFSVTCTNDAPDGSNVSDRANLAVLVPM